MLDIEAIRYTTNSTYLSRGKSYYKQGRVFELESEGEQAYSAVVKGTRKYRVSVELSEDGSEVYDWHCNCPIGDEEDACKHVVATLFAIREEQKKEEGFEKIVQHIERTNAKPAQVLEALMETFGEFKNDLKTGRDLAREQKKKRDAKVSKELFEFYAPQVESAQENRCRQRIQLVPKLMVVEMRGGYERWLEFKVGEDRLYVLKDPLSFRQCVKEGQSWPLGTKNSIDTSNFVWADETSEKLFKLIDEARRRERDLMSCSEYGYYSYGYYGRSLTFDAKKFKLGNENFAKFLEIMAGQPFEFNINNSQTETVETAPGNPPFKLTVEREDDGGGLIDFAVGDTACFLDDENRYLYVDGKIYHTDDDFDKDVRPFMYVARNNPHGISLSPQDMTRFFSLVLPRLRRVVEVEVAEGFEDKFIFEPLACELYLDYEGEGISVRPVYAYGDNKFNPLVDKKLQLPRGQQLVRNESGEKEIELRLANYGFQPEGNRYVQRDEERSYDFLYEELPALPEWVEIFYEDAFQEKPVRRMPKVTAGVSVNDDNLLEVSFKAEDLDFKEMMDILASYRKKRRYHRLKDRTFVTLGDQQLAALAEFVENTGLGKKNVKAGETAVLPLAQAMYIDTLARENQGDITLKRSQIFRQVVRRVRSPQDSDYEVPASLTDTLRDYQVTGFNWLSGLAQCHLGGILADDMGLGKTLQVLTFLLAKKEEDEKEGKVSPPSLVVAPTSLVYNWLDEARRFTPRLKAIAVAGTKEEREEILKKSLPQKNQPGEADLLITTYNMLKRDIDLYAPCHFRYAILDEAQHIKNPGTQNAHSVKQLQAEGFFALTGTPIENTLTELWSLFDYLMPGYLLTQPKFKQKYETPIVKEQDEQAAADLRRHIMPFILRRLKQDVLTELPDKVERRQTCEMTPKQDKVYKAWFLKSQKEFNEALKERNIGETKIKILAILTRLRQIACDPSLFLEDYNGGSGKLDVLEEIVGDAVEAGHRLLIFSQFTTLLGHIGDRLQKMGMKYHYLDGSTPALERLNLVKSFNAGNRPVFLISLKAGGTGLNLTGADMVLHVDPWWNPAVEDQATDRAYRLGQKNNVQVVRLIMKDTVEEKIYDLQQKKKNLIDKMIQPGENFLSKLTDEEIRELFQR
ncbi:DEAD/DEAH box helicase [Selenomonas sp. AB3002]|uniref:DEAD/DEAH box helicase n=1 Tax=Selenomonas sp. AB3002 TaxID=1392502 RepID=UPI00068F396E